MADGPHIYALSRHGGFDRAYAVKGTTQVTANWLAVPPEGVRFRLADGEEVRQGPPRAKPFETFDEAARYVEKALGLESGWAPEKGRTSWWIPKAGSTDRPCEQPTYSSGRAASWSVCDRRRKPGEEKCGQHLAADRKQAEKEAAHKAATAASEAASERAQEAIDALAVLGIKADKDYSQFGRRGYTGSVVVRAEDVLALLDRI